MKSWEIEDYCYKQGLNEGKAAGLREGKATGIKEGILQNLVSLVKKGLLDKETAAKEADISLSELEKLLSKKETLPAGMK